LIAQQSKRLPKRQRHKRASGIVKPGSGLAFLLDLQISSSNQINMNSILIVITTLPNIQEAKTLGRSLLDHGLAACIQIQEGVHSIYRWDDQICEETEVLLSAKTNETSWPALESYIVEHHPYDLPEIIALSPSQYSEAYGAWVSKELK
jgi:periplasmic divalent cation tolerance protein